MVRSLTRLGDRLLAAVLPHADAAALTCWRTTCHNHTQRLCCVNYGCETVRC